MRAAVWRLSDDEMCNVLDWHPQVVDARPNAPMLRSVADHLLRKLAELGEPQTTLALGMAGRPALVAS